MSETLTMPVVEQRKCAIEEVFEVSFIELLKLAPANPYVRALVLKFTGRMPPTECQTFEQLADWVECNCAKRIRKLATISNNTEPVGIVIPVEFSDKEYGRADYSVDRSASEDYSVSAENLMEFIQDAIEDGSGIEGIIDVVGSRIDDDAWSQCDPDMNDSGDYEYSNHDGSDSENSGVNYSRHDIRNAVLRFVRERHPELADEL